MPDIEYLVIDSSGVVVNSFLNFPPILDDPTLSVVVNTDGTARIGWSCVINKSTGEFTFTEPPQAPPIELPITQGPFNFVVIGNISPGTYYLTPGNQYCDVLNDGVVFSIPFVQKTIVYAITSYCQNIHDANITIKLFNTTDPNADPTECHTNLFSPTQFGPTIELSSDNPYDITRNFSSSFNAFNSSSPNYLQLQITVKNKNDPSSLRSGLKSNSGLFITLATF